MNITLNGSIFINGEEIYFEDFDIAIDEDLDLPFDDFDEDSFDYCDDDCEFCDCDCDDFEEDECEIEFDLDNDERFELYSDDYKKLLSKYVRKIYDTDFCPYCLSEVLNEFLEDYFDNY